MRMANDIQQTQTEVNELRNDVCCTVLLPMWIHKYYDLIVLLWACIS